MKKTFTKLKPVKIRCIHQYQPNIYDKKVQDTDPTTITIATLTHVVQGGW